MKIFKKYFLLLLLLPTMAWGQELMVRDFHLDVGNLNAVENQVLDYNNKPCALIKVRLPYYQLFFEGDVIYTEHQCNNEYWVYMSAGATWLRVKGPVVSPLTVNFDLEVEELRTYIMQLHLDLSRFPQKFEESQELRVSTFKEDNNNKINVKDNTLVKVKLESFALCFSGEIDSVVPKWNEYWVYMHKGATQLEISSSIAPPLTYDFGKKLKKDHIYVLQLELKNPVTLPKSQPTTKINTYNTVTTTKKEEGGTRNFIGLLYGTAANANSKEYGFRYGQIYSDFGMFGWYSEIALASSTPAHIWRNDDHVDTLISNSENLHINLGCFFGSNKIALTLSMGFALGTGTNGSGAVTMGAGLMSRLDNVLFSFDYEWACYLGSVAEAYSVSGHYLKFGIGYVF